MSSVPSASRFDYAELLQLERARLLGLVRSLDPPAWDRPTCCPGWTVLGLAVHLLGDDLAFLAHERDGWSQGRAPDSMAESAFVDWIDTLQAEWVEAATKRLSPRLVVDLLATTGDQVADLVRHQDGAIVEARVSWASDGLVPKWLDHARELTERWIHRQQILDALDRDDDLHPDLAEPVLDAMRWSFPFRLSAENLPEGSGVEIALTGLDEPLKWHLRATELGWRFDEQAVAHPVATLRCTANEMWRLLSNNLTEAEREHLVVEGDPRAIATLVRTRAIIGTPHWRQPQVPGAMARRET